jgi:hypothetical protein
VNLDAAVEAHQRALLGRPLGEGPEPGPGYLGRRHVHHLLLVRILPPVFEFFGEVEVEAWLGFDFGLVQIRFFFTTLNRFQTRGQVTLPSSEW